MVKKRRRVGRWSSEQEMYPAVKRSLSQLFPAKEGWTIHKQFKGGSGTYIPDFVVERTRRKYTEKVPVEVKFTDKLSKSHIEQLNRYSSAIAGPAVKVVLKMIYVPDGCNISVVEEFSEGDVPLDVRKI